MGARCARGRGRSSGSADALGEQLGGQRPRRRALAGAARAVEQVGVRGPRPRPAPARGRRGRGGGVRARRAWAAIVAPGNVEVRAMARGKLITIEGLDGAGKTTLARRSARRAARARGRRRSCCASPAACALAERIRELVKDPELRIGARAEALLYAAARAQLVEEALEPLLAARRVGAAGPVRRLLARVSGRRPRAGRRARCAEINEFATGGLTPDRTLLLTIDPPVGRERSHGRSEPLRPPRGRARRLL